jgi:purine-binding chemotaxis protein CheW
MSEKKTAGKYLTFVLELEEYGVPVLSVREIIKMLDIDTTPASHVSPHVKGVINLRGKKIPVIDLRLKLGLAATENTERTCIIVVEVVHAARYVFFGMIVDWVSEVLSIVAEEIEEAPASAVNFGTEHAYVQGVVKTRGEIKLLLDLDRIASAETF